MILAYRLAPHDDGTHMLGGGTYRPPRSAGFHDWRFGKDGVPHPATCGTCGRKTDPNYVNPSFSPKKRWDISATYDGYCIVSCRFRDFCLIRRWQGMTFVRLPADMGFFVLRLSSVLRFDAERRRTRFEHKCPTCGAYYSVIGADPTFLRDVTEPIKEGFFRSDLEFGSGPTQHPLILLGIDTAEKLRRERFQNYYLREVTS